MSSAQGSWLSERLTARTFLKPHQVARAVFHPAWIPEAVDPSVEQLKRVRIIAGAIAALGVYTFVEGGFAFDEMLDNAATASAVLFFITPLTVGVMLFVWRRGGTVRQLKGPLLSALKLLLLFIGSVFGTVLLFRLGDVFGVVAKLVLSLVGMWMAVFVITGAVKLSGNFFGTAVVHRGLPPLLATVTTWLMALPDLFTGDLHGLSLTMGIVFILGAPVTVTGIALLELRRLRQRYGVRLAAHPAILPRITPPQSPPPAPPPPPYAPQGAGGFVPPPGHPYGSPPGHPYGPPAGSPYGPPQGSPYGPPQNNPHGNPYNNPYNPRSPYGT
ncbi:proline-rich domain-containing protein [Streptomyces sp. NPDC050788]|uniref:proline-rich domain-containing protein n=1 Tax=Streptomyces sp. NPDC050788 TaxID=3155041 RepID=UPI00343BB7BC